MDERRSPAVARCRTAAVALFQFACVAYVLHALWADRAALGGALELWPSALLLLTGLMVIAHLQRTLEFTYMLGRLGVRERFRDGFVLTAAGYLLNHLPFNAGFVMRAALLKRDHSLSYASYLSLTMVGALINVAVGALIGLVAAANGLAQGRSGLMPIAAFAATVAACVVVIWLPPSLTPRRGGFVAHRVRALLGGAASIRGNWLGMLMLAGLALTRIGGNALRLWLCFEALGAHISPLAAALLGWGSVLFTLVNVTPGNLGLRELVLSVVAAELGSTQSLGMAASSIDRVVLLGYVFAVGVPALFMLKRRSSVTTE